MPGNGNGGGGWTGGGNTSSFSNQGWVSGEGGTVAGGGAGPGTEPRTSGEGGGGGPIDLSGWIDKPDEPKGPEPHVPVIREARNVQRANIDRSSLYDPTQATQDLGADYLQTRNASNPQPLGSTGAGAVGYEFTPSDERLY